VRKIALILSLLGMFSATAPARADSPNVVMKNFDFSPMAITVAAGTTVTWMNLDGEPHTVTSADGLFRSPALDQNDSYSFKFAKPGVYKYICSIHPRMMATVTVK
jgi:plastocyanin